MRYKKMVAAGLSAVLASSVMSCPVFAGTTKTVTLGSVVAVSFADVGVASGYRSEADIAREYAQDRELVTNSTTKNVGGSTGLGGIGSSGSSVPVVEDLLPAAPAVLIRTE